MKNGKGELTLQIVEAAQLNFANPIHKQALENASHFNPVELVCSITDYQKNKFNLLDYRDDSTGFISLKSYSGKTLKALELPGLWNGSMAKWNTIFVEIPIEIFNPVKTINDLLKEAHQC